MSKQTDSKQTAQPDSKYTGAQKIFHKNLQDAFEDKDKILVDGQDFYKKIGIEEYSSKEKVAEAIEKFQHKNSSDIISIQGIKEILLKDDTKKSYDAKLKKHKEEQKSNPVDVPIPPLNEPTAVQDTSNIPMAPDMNTPNLKDKAQTESPPTMKEATRSNKWAKIGLAVGIVLGAAIAVAATVLTGGLAAPIVAAMIIGGAALGTGIVGAGLGNVADSIIYANEKTANYRDHNTKMAEWNKDRPQVVEQSVSKEIAPSLGAQATAAIQGVKASASEASTADSKTPTSGVSTAQKSSQARG
jgi:hypothetical protein